MSAFARIALVAAGCAIIVGLAAVWMFLSPWAALTAGVVGPLLATAVTIDQAPPAQTKGRTVRRIGG